MFPAGIHTTWKCWYSYSSFATFTCLNLWYDDFVPIHKLTKRCRSSCRLLPISPAAAPARQPSSVQALVPNRSSRSQAAGGSRREPPTAAAAVAAAAAPFRPRRPPAAAEKSRLQPAVTATTTTLRTNHTRTFGSSTETCMKSTSRHFPPHDSAVTLPLWCKD